MPSKACFGENDSSQGGVVCYLGRYLVLGIHILYEVYIYSVCTKYILLIYGHNYCCIVLTYTTAVLAVALLCDDL